MSNEKKDVRLQIVAAPSDVAAIDEWRRQQPDLPSRSEAIRRMIRQVVGGDHPKEYEMKVI